MRKKITILLLTGFQFLSLAAQPVTYHVQLIKTSSLANPNQVLQMIKDDNGFLWLLSPSKIQRFDGRNLKSFSFSDRLICIQQDKEGTIWLASKQNIYRYQNDYTGFKLIMENNPDSVKYRSLLAGPGKNIYLLTLNNILCWNYSSNKFETIGIHPFKSNTSFPFLKSVDNWLFYRPNDKTIARFNVKTNQTDSLHVNDAMHFFPVNADSAWVQQGVDKSSALISFNTRTVTTISAAQFEEKFTSNRFYVTGFFKRSADEDFVMMNETGYFIYRKSEKKFIKANLFYHGLPLPNETPSNSFYQEENGTVWLTNEEGLVFFNPYTNNFGLLRSNNTGNNKSWNNQVRNFTEDQKGNIWFATGGGFCKWNKKNNNVSVWLPNFEAGNYLNYSSVRSIGYNANKIIVGQSEKGFWIFDPVTNTFKRPQFDNDSIKEKFGKEFNNNMIRLRNGNFLVLSSHTWLIEKASFHIRQLNFTGAASILRNAYEDAQGRLWFAGVGGIFVTDNTFKDLYALPDKEKGQWLNAIVQIDTATFWVAAKNLFEIKIAADNRLTIKPIFPELKEILFSLLFKDSLLHIWMCNDKGIYRYIPEKQTVEKFGQSDNIQSFYASITNCFRGSDGTVYFGSTNGINYFTPEKIPLQNDSLQIQITNVTVNQDDSSFLLQRNLPVLENYQNTIAFDFIAPYIYGAEKIQYRYKLEGADKDWVYTGNNSSVRFTSLQPGMYTFYIAASLNGKDWYHSAHPLTFQIKPPFWETWWFRLLAVLLISYLIFYFAKDRINKIKQREKLKGDYERKIAEVEMQALRAQMNPHFMFNSLNSINNFILKNDPENASGYLTKFSRLMRLILDNSRSEWVLLENELKALELYIELESVRFDRSFDYAIEVTKDISLETVLIPPLIIQPYVENAIWHGLLHRKIPGGRLDIRLWRKEDKLYIEIEDNGVGRDEAKRLKSKTATIQKSHGMKITAERIDIVNKVYNVNTGVTITDLKNDTGTQNGTAVLITLKYKTHESHNS